MIKLIDYVKKYGDISFDNKPFNDVDNLVFCSLIYLDFSNTSINENIHTLEEIANEYIKPYKTSFLKRIGIIADDVYELLKVVKDKIRYKNIILSNYEYKFSGNMQFCAMTFNISKKLKYICFEGTDTLVSGWKEDFELSCYFPVSSHTEAINYVNKNISMFGPKVIIGGHSKGGNLALISSMFMKWYKKNKVIKVYSNDGPGLRKKEIESKKYKRIKKKFIHIVPENSVVGMLLRTDDYYVIKTSKNNILSHSLTYWLIDDDKISKGVLSDKSIKLHDSVLYWLNIHNDYERRIMTEMIFKIFEEAKVKDLTDLKKIKNLIKVLYNMKNMDRATKELLTNLVFNSYNN